MSPDGYLTFDAHVLSQALQLSADDVHSYFTDGRRVSFVLERRLSHVLGGTLSGLEKSGYDLIDKDGNRWEVRSVTKGGVYFRPSVQVGSGRHFEKSGFLEK